MDLIAITSLQEYLTEVDKIYQDRTKHIFFRGHSDKTGHDLIPSIFRLDKRGRRTNEREVLLDFKQYAPAHSLNYEFPADIDRYLIEMQHYQVPTRLLDWTFAPLAALFFACSKNRKKDGQVIILDPWRYQKVLLGDIDHPEIHDIHVRARSLLANNWKFADIASYIGKHFHYKDFNDQDLLNPYPFVARFTNPRILHQRGCFTIHGTCEDALEKIKIINEFLVRIDIVADSKNRIMRELNQLYINNYTIYPDYKGMSEMIKRHKGLFNL